MAFAAGALVFPGGRVDAGDRDLGQRFAHLDADDAAARVAAIRETIEEAGVAIGLDRICDAATVTQLRAHLHDGVPFADALAALDLGLTLDCLVPFARWRPNFQETRTFDTRFYLAALPPGAADASVDATENVHVFWATAQRVLDDAAAGRAHVIFPTRRNLERLAALADFAAASAHAAQFAPTTITPWIEQRDGIACLCIPDGLGYPIISEPMANAVRG